MFTLTRGTTRDPASLRRHFPTWRYIGREDVRGDPEANRAYVLSYVRRHGYRRVVLPYPDWGMENYPELIGHHFGDEAPELWPARATLYERPG